MPKIGKALGARVYGAAFLALCVLFVYLTYAVFTKKFTPYDEVTLQSSKIGLSLPARADVKVRGVLVGEVLETTTDGDGAKLTLGLYPDMRDSVPADVTGRILPKTLFGEKFVSLEVPDGEAAGAEPIAIGAVIKQSEVAIEVEEVLNDLFPLLRAVRPGDLNVTLNAIATALEGRGDKLGEGLETFNSYLGKLNPEIPALVESLDQLGQVSAVYEDVVPEVARLLRNTVKTTQTFESEADRIEVLFDDVAGFADTTRGFLEKNGDNIIRLADAGQRVLPLLARYSPEYKCFLRGAVASIAPNESAFRNKTLHIKLETVPQPRGYNTGDQPQFADSRGPFKYCADMYAAINGKYSQENLPPRSLTSPQIRDGVNYPLGKRVAVGDAVVGTQEQKDVIGLAAAAAMQRPVNEVPDVATLLIGSLAQGKAVDVR
jgi:phospholipid/cholesterol/gamma-HCH transport system substrate-binding protein